MAAYPDLKSYLHAKHKEILEEAVQKYVDGHLDGSGFHDLNVLSLTSYELDNFEIKSVRCKDELGVLWSSFFVTFLANKIKLLSVSILAVSATLDNGAEGYYQIVADSDDLKNRFFFLVSVE